MDSEVPEMVDIEVTGTTVRVRVLGVHRIFALREEVVFDLANITQVQPAKIDQRPPWVRTPGTFFPGVIAAGTFRGRGRKEFWDTVFDGRGVRIDLTGADFTCLVVDVADSAEVFRLLRPAAAA